MTETQHGWIDWNSFVQNYEVVKGENYAEFNRQLREIASKPLRQLFLDAAPALSRFTFEEATLGLKVRLGEEMRDGTVIWRAAAGLSPQNARLGLPGLNGPTAKVYAFWEGLNIWIEVPNQQSGEYFRSALVDDEVRHKLLDTLIEFSKLEDIYLTVGTQISYNDLLWTKYAEMTKNISKHSSPFKDTVINSENRELVEDILRLYAQGVDKQTIFIINFFLKAEKLTQSTEAVALQVKHILEAANQIAELIHGVSMDAVPLQNGDDKEHDKGLKKDMTSLKALTHFTRNIILYGPPGTGKTYAVQGFQKQFLKNSIQPIEQTPDLSYSLRWHILALTLYQAGVDEALSVNTMLQEQPLARYEALRGSKTPYASIMTELIERGLDGDDKPVNEKYQRSPAIFLKLPNKTWTLTQQGRQYVEANLLTQVKADWSAEPESRLSFVTFHPSFAYEEFVEGLRPEMDEEGQLTYRVRDGVFKLICRQAEQELHEAKAANREARPFLLVIDEINRANIAKVFGELMTLIEDDKRVTAHGGGLRVRLPYSGDLFGVPENLYILGTMNTADRSIALLDLALRRRFTFLEVLPDPEVVRRTSGDGGVVDGVDIADLLGHLNAKLRIMLDRDHQLGHSYLTGIKGGLDELHFRWYRKVIPLLQEYFYNDGEKLQQVLSTAFVKLGERTGGIGGRRDYDIVDIQDDAFRQALMALLPVSSPAVTVPEEPDDE